MGHPLLKAGFIRSFACLLFLGSVTIASQAATPTRQISPIRSKSSAVLEADVQRRMAIAVYQERVSDAFVLALVGPKLLGPLLHEASADPGATSNPEWLVKLGGVMLVLSLYGDHLSRLTPVPREAASAQVLIGQVGRELSDLSADLAKSADAKGADGFQAVRDRIPHITELCTKAQAELNRLAKEYPRLRDLPSKQ